MTRRRFLEMAAGSAAGLACAAPRAPGPGGAGMRILVLGGTSFLGPELVLAARARGHVLTLFNRGKTNPGLFPDVEQLHGDRDGKLDALRGRRWDAAVDTSGYVPRIVRASAELLAPAVERYLFVSTVSTTQQQAMLIAQFFFFLPFIFLQDDGDFSHDPFTGPPSRDLLSPRDPADGLRLAVRLRPPL